VPSRPGTLQGQPRGAKLFERVKELAFARAGGDRAEPQATQLREPEPAPFAHAEEPRPAFAGSAQDELADVPAFLRRERFAP
jgi:hypothetical protein